MTEHAASRLRGLVSPRRAAAPGRGGRWAAALLLRVGCTALLAWIGYIHLHLWLEGYRHIPTNGPLFLLDAVAGFILAAVVLAWPRPLAGLLAPATPPLPSAPCSSASAWACSASGSRSRRRTSPNPWPSRRSPCSPSSPGPSWWQPPPAACPRPAVGRSTAPPIAPADEIVGESATLAASALTQSHRAAASLPARRRAAEAATRTGQPRPVPRPKMRSRRRPDQRISPGRMMWMRFRHAHSLRRAIGRDCRRVRRPLE